VQDYFDRSDGSGDDISDDEMECGKAIVFLSGLNVCNATSKKHILKKSPGTDQQESDSDSEQGI